MPLRKANGLDLQSSHNGVPSKLHHFRYRFNNNTFHEKQKKWRFSLHDVSIEEVNPNQVRASTTEATRSRLRKHLLLTSHSRNDDSYF